MLKNYIPQNGLHIRSNIERACEQAKLEGATLSYLVMGITLEITPTTDASQKWEAFLLTMKKFQSTRRRDRLEHADLAIDELLEKLLQLDNADLQWLTQYGTLQPRNPDRASTPAVRKKLADWAMSYDPLDQNNPFNHAHWMALYMLPYVQEKKRIPDGWNTPITEKILQTRTNTLEHFAPDA